MDYGTGAEETPTAAQIMNEYPPDSEYWRIFDAHIVRHTVNFTHESADGLRAAGSGILAFIGNVAGILTCGHVLRGIHGYKIKPGQGLLGLSVSAVRDHELQAIKMTYDEFRGCPAAIIGGDGGRDNDMGPDLGFVRLPAATINVLSALGSALDLRAQMVLSSQGAPENASEGMTLATGVAHEMIGAPEAVKGVMAVPLATAVLPCVLHREPPNGVYDRIRLEPRGGENYPKSYEGVSGGGIWAVALKREGASLAMVERRLMGIAYYQTAPDDKGERQLIAHGPTSIYQHLIPQIVALENEPMP